MSILRKQLVEVERARDKGDKDKLEAIKAFNREAARHFTENITKIIKRG